MSDPILAASPSPVRDDDSSGPLGDLALSFSGGGYRAAAFHLGALRILQRMGLLRDVVALSTVSGGSILGAAWVLSVVRGEGFAAFDRRFADYLVRTNVIREALDHLTSHREHGHPDFPSLIRSAARVYARPDLFGDARMGDIRVPVESADGPRFREVIFNSTQFRTGEDFRFVRSADPDLPLHGGPLHLPHVVDERVRVADAVAASSCFPGGFEPLLFPQQFHWPAEMPLPKVEEALGAGFEGGVPLMDGGIWDNQGVESLVLAFHRGRAATLVVSDVAAREDDIYNFPKGHTRGWVTLRMVSILGWVLFGASLVSAVLLAVAGVDAWQAGAHGGFLFRYGIPFVFCAVVAVALGWLRVLLYEVEKTVRKRVEIADVWHDLARLTVREALMMVELRVGSLLKLTSTLFMKRIRTLVFDNVVSGDPEYQGKLMANFIYAMDLEHPELFAQHPWLAPSPAMRKLAKDAEAFPTTLWFDTREELEMVARAGEATMCFVLLQFIVENREADLRNPESPVSKLFARLRQEWAAFNGSPAT
jgi:Patatin-like phospholipase